MTATPWAPAESEDHPEVETGPPTEAVPTKDLPRPCRHHKSINWIIAGVVLLTALALVSIFMCFTSSEDQAIRYGLCALTLVVAALALAVLALALEVENHK